MKKKENYFKKFVEEYGRINSLNDESAYKRARSEYRKALRLYPKEERTFNVAREIYYSYRGTKRNLNVFEFEDEQLVKQVKTKKEIILNQFSDLLAVRNNGKVSKLDREIADYLWQYKNDLIDYKTLKEKIDAYKQTAEYNAIQRERVKKR